MSVRLNFDLKRKGTVRSQKVVENLQDHLKESNARVIDLFKQWDLNNDGVISQEEVRAHCRLLLCPYLLR